MRLIRLNEFSNHSPNESDMKDIRKFVDRMIQGLDDYDSNRLKVKVDSNYSGYKITCRIINGDNYNKILEYQKVFKTYDMIQEFVMAIYDNDYDRNDLYEVFNGLMDEYGLKKVL